MNTNTATCIGCKATVPSEAVDAPITEWECDKIASHHDPACDWIKDQYAWLDAQYERNTHPKLKVSWTDRLLGRVNARKAKAETREEWLAKRDAMEARDCPLIFTW